MKNLIFLFKKTENFFLLISLFSFIFLWGVQFQGIQLRFLILIIVFHLLLKIYLDLKKKKFNFLISIFFLLLILIFHLYLNYYEDTQSIKGRQYLGILLFTYIFFVAYYFYDGIEKIKIKIISTFYPLFFISILVGLYNKKTDDPYFCGGIKNIFFSLADYNSKFFQFFFKDLRVIDLLRWNELNLSYSEYFFNENSHLGMLAVGLICYSFFIICQKKTSFLFKIFFFLFLILCFIKSSTTLLVGLIVSCIIFLLSEFKRMNLKLIITLLFLLLSASFIFFSDKNCKARLSPEYGYEFSESAYASFTKKNLKIFSGNITSAVYFYSFKIASNSLIERPFGWGLNNYETAYLSISSKFPPMNEEILSLNTKDASNNFVKILVEFGIFGLLFYGVFIYYIFNNQINLETKFFLIPFIITQSLRGAGYFNGGFILFVFIIIISLIRRLKKK